MTTDSTTYYDSPVQDVALIPHNGIVSVSIKRTNAPPVIQTVATTSPYQDMVVSAFPDAPKMLQVCKNESSCIPTARNSHSSAVGLFQILTGTWQAYDCGPLESRVEASSSIACARKIYDKEGYAPWSSSGDYQ